MAVFKGSCFATVRFKGYLNDKSYARAFDKLLQNEVYYEESYEAGRGRNHEFIIVLKFTSKRKKGVSQEELDRFNTLKAVKALSVLHMLLPKSKEFPSNGKAQLSEDGLILTILNKDKW